MNRMSRRWWVLILVGTILCFLSGAAECGIILKSLVVNPSKTKTQKAVLKAYLPKEAKPEDIVDLGDLKVDYDITNALYYVYKEFELAPGESAERSLEIRDVWAISKVETDALREETKDKIERLKGTAYSEKAADIQKNIEAKISEILKKQEKAMAALPQTHIAVYRENVRRVDSIKSNLAKLDEMILEIKLTSSGAVGEKISVKATWWVIMAVIVSLGLFSLILYIIWHRQATIVQREEKERTRENV